MVDSRRPNITADPDSAGPDRAADASASERIKVDRQAGSITRSERAPVGQLDLGLRALAEAPERPAFGGGGSVSTLTPEGASSPRSPREPAPAAATPPATEPDVEYVTLADNGAWSQLSSLAEARVDRSHGRDIGARLWWIKSQLELGGVPVSILAAPLESATKVVDEGGALPRGIALGARTQRLMAELLAVIGARLRTNGEDLLAATFLFRAFRLGEISAIEVREYLQAIVNRRPPVRRDPARERLLERAQKWLAELPAAAAVAPTAAAPASPASIPTKRAVGRGDEARAAPVTRPAARNWTAYLVIAIIGAVTTWRLLELNGDSGRMAEIGVASALLEAPLGGAGTALDLPVERVTNLSQLDALISELDRGGSRAGLSLPSSSTGAKPPTRKEQVDTTGPVEGPEFEQLRAGGGRPAGDVGDLLFGGPQPRLTVAPGTAGLVGDDGAGRDRLPDGKLKQVQYFQLLVSAPVRARPEVGSGVIGELRAGAQVQAEGEVGRFLKIRSKSGGVGYIDRQDVEPIRGP